MKTIGLIAGALLLAAGETASAESRLIEGIDIARACAGDVKKLCADVGLREVKACIKDKLTELSAPCFDAILTAVTSGKAPPPDDSATAKVQRFDNLRGMRYCEIFLISGDPATEALTANFFNTSDLNNQADPKDTCPPEMWAKVDPKSLEAQYAVIGVFKNGPRGWANDWIELPAGEVRTFDGLEARWMGNVNLPKDFGTKGATAYHPTQVHRNSSMTFEKGKPVFILDDPNGTPWVMQAYSAIVNPNLTLRRSRNPRQQAQARSGMVIPGQGARRRPDHQGGERDRAHRPGRPREHLRRLFRHRLQLQALTGLHRAPVPGAILPIPENDPCACP